MENKLDRNIILRAIDDKSISVEVFDVCDSTNSAARRKIEENPKSALLVVSDAQTCGRGRRGNSFYSPGETGIYMSLLFLRKEISHDGGYVTICAANAVCQVINSLCKKDLRIKWVNDIFCAGKKVCGILTEAVGEYIICGIGVNCKTEIFPEEIKNVAGSVGTEISRNRLIAEITNEFFKKLNLSKNEIIAEYKSRLFILGKNIKFFKDGKELSAIAVDINENGYLIVETDGNKITLCSGEISLGSDGFTY